MFATILLTGFEPFGSYTRNPTAELVQRMDGTHSDHRSVVRGATLPASYTRASQIAAQLISELSPLAVLSLGYASRIPRIRIEARGFNWMDSDYKDSEGRLYRGATIDANGPDHRDTNADNQELVRQIIACGIPAELSFDPERFICNRLIYDLIRVAEELGVLFAYMHIPTPTSCAELIKEHPGKTTISDEQLHRAVIAALNFLSSQGPDIT